MHKKLKKFSFRQIPEIVVFPDLSFSGRKI